MTSTITETQTRTLGYTSEYDLLSFFGKSNKRRKRKHKTATTRKPRKYTPPKPILESNRTGLFLNRLFRKPIYDDSDDSEYEAFVDDSDSDNDDDNDNDNDAGGESVDNDAGGSVDNDAGGNSVDNSVDDTSGIEISEVGSSNNTTQPEAQPEPQPQPQPEPQSRQRRGSIDEYDEPNPTDGEPLAFENLSNETKRSILLLAPVVDVEDEKLDIVNKTSDLLLIIVKENGEYKIRTNTKPAHRFGKSKKSLLTAYKKDEKDKLGMKFNGGGAKMIIPKNRLDKRYEKNIDKPGWLIT